MRRESLERNRIMNRENAAARRPTASRVRRTYVAKLVGRCVILSAAFVLCFAAPEQFTVLEGKNFFRQFSLFHLLWAVWMLDMFYQLIPVKNEIALGSQKLWRHRFRPIRDKINTHLLKQYIVSTTKSAYLVMLLWAAMIAVLGVLRARGVIGEKFLLMTSVVFYVCDLICVLIWCPFRLILKNRCCTTCRIFNWDHLMMFSPLIFVSGFYARSLVIVAAVCWMIWELCVLQYPERFWEWSNEALKCSNCTDKLCTQYCQKLR